MRFTPMNNISYNIVQQKMPLTRSSHAKVVRRAFLTRTQCKELWHSSSVAFKMSGVSLKARFGWQFSFRPAMPERLCWSYFRDRRNVRQRSTWLNWQPFIATWQMHHHSAEKLCSIYALSGTGAKTCARKQAHAIDNLHRNKFLRMRARYSIFQHFGTASHI